MTAANNYALTHIKQFQLQIKTNSFDRKMFVFLLLRLQNDDSLRTIDALQEHAKQRAKQLYKRYYVNISELIN